MYHVAVDKAGMVRLRAQGGVRQFKLNVFPRGHTPTDYDRWCAASDPYQVEYAREYEPWFISHWDMLPW